MIELSQINCFLTINEEQSFSRAAAKLGLAQSAVSQKLKRLEDVLNITLFSRTSRSLQLTPEGKEFLPFAIKMIDSEQNARTAAQEIKNRTTNTLILGGYNFTNHERTILIEKFLTDHKKYRVEVHFGTRQELVQKLKSHELDAVSTLAMPDDYDKEFDFEIIGKKYGHIAIPIDNPLSANDTIIPKDLINQKIALSPGRLDSKVLNRVWQHLIDSGAEIISAPEAEPNAIEKFAHLKNILYLRWYYSLRPAFNSNEYAIIPFEEPNMVMDSVVYFNKGASRKIINDFVATTKSVFLN